MTEKELRGINNCLSEWMIAQGRIEGNQGIQEVFKKFACENYGIDPDVFEEIAMSSYKATIKSESRSNCSPP